MLAPWDVPLARTGHVALDIEKMRSADPDNPLVARAIEQARELVATMTELRNAVDAAWEKDNPRRA